MNLQNLKNRNWNYVRLSFGFTFIAFVVLMIVKGMVPFGDSSMLYSDAYHQYYPFFVAFRKALRSGESLLYSWDVGMGMDYLGLISYYLASPLNLLSVLIPESWTLAYFSFLVPIKLGLASWFFALFLQKTTHDIDYINFLTGERPVTVCAKTAKLHFKGDHPAGLRCPDCPEYRTCSESSYVVKNVLKEDVTGDECCFAVDTGNEDGGSAIFTTESGMIISYNQNFTVKKNAGRRGCRLIGTKGSAEFDFYTAEIRHDDYLEPQTINHKFTFPPGAHFGGDERLALDFMRVLNGEPAQSHLGAGLESAAACLAAKAADEAGCFVPVEY
jgi:hypothetical protein